MLHSEILDDAPGSIVFLHAINGTLLPDSLQSV